MNQLNVMPKDLIHNNERKYFIFALLVSLITYVGLFLSVIGIIYVAIFLGLSLFLHALMLASIRTNGVRINPEQFPQIYDKVKELCEKMEMPYIPDVYVIESSGALNAFATRFFGRNMVVLYSTVFELIEQNANDELNFVIAHELAHLKRRHISKQLMIFPALWVPFMSQAYSRACEYTCDRYAAYYTGNPEAAKNGLTIFSIGSTLYKYVNRSKYVNQMNEEKGFFIWLSEKLSTHPPLPKRINHIEWYFGNAEHVLHSRNSKKLWIYIPVTLLLIGAVMAGGVYALEKIDLTTLVDEVLVELETETETPPLINTVVDGDIDQVHALLEDGADPDLQDIDGWTALHWSVTDNNTEITQALLEAGADPNLMDNYGEVPLMKAAGNGQAENTKLLLEAGANIDEQDFAGWTPLMYAVISEDIETVEILLAAGANTTLTDFENLTATMHAIRLGNDDIVNLLRNAKAK